MYVRIKRLNQTYFEEVDPSDSFLSIKERLGVEMNQEPQNIQFWHADKVYQLSREQKGLLMHMLGT